SDHNGFSMAVMTRLSASWIVAQLSTSVLSQSNKIARGRGRPCGAAAARLRAVTLLPSHEPDNARHAQRPNHAAHNGRRRKRYVTLLFRPPGPAGGTAPPPPLFGAVRARSPLPRGTEAQAPIFTGRSLPKTPRDFN